MYEMHTRACVKQACDILSNTTSKRIEDIPLSIKRCRSMIISTIIFARYNLILNDSLRVAAGPR